MNKVLMAQNLTLSYNNNETIINKANLSIDAGNFVFVTGASGSGKSTFLKSLYGSLKPKSGDLIVGGVSMREASKSKINYLRRHLGIVFQDYKLVKEWTIEKNIMLPLLISGYTKNVGEAQVEKLLAHVKLSHQIGKYPLELSGGEQQRVAVARALAHNPIVILADEPTGNLDEYSSEVIWRLLEGANKQLKTTVIVVTHHIPETMSVDYRQYHIEYGTMNEIV